MIYPGAPLMAELDELLVELYRSQEMLELTLAGC
jgi:hypothetical protein